MRNRNCINTIDAMFGDIISHSHQRRRTFSQVIYRFVDHKLIRTPMRPRKEQEQKNDQWNGSQIYCKFDRRVKTNLSLLNPLLYLLVHQTIIDPANTCVNNKHIICSADVFALHLKEHILHKRSKYSLLTWKNNNSVRAQ